MQLSPGLLPSCCCCTVFCFPDSAAPLRKGVISRRCKQGSVPRRSLTSIWATVALHKAWLCSPLYIFLLVVQSSYRAHTSGMAGHPSSGADAVILIPQYIDYWWMAYGSPYYYMTRRASNPTAKIEISCYTSPLLQLMKSLCLASHTIDNTSMLRAYVCCYCCLINNGISIKFTPAAVCLEKQWQHTPVGRSGSTNYSIYCVKKSAPQPLILPAYQRRPAAVVTVLR